MDSVEFIDYSDKSFVVRGEKTKEYVQRLKEEGGKFNNYLTDKVTGKKFGGWIFKKSDLDRIKLIFDEVESEVVSVKKVVEEIYEEVNELTEQYIEFKIVRPVLGVKVKIVYGKNNISGVVVEIKEKNNIVYQCLVKDINTKMYINIGILGFEWKILDTILESNVTFIV